MTLPRFVTDKKTRIENRAIEAALINVLVQRLSAPDNGQLSHHLKITAFKEMIANSPVHGFRIGPPGICHREELLSLLICRWGGRGGSSKGSLAFIVPPPPKIYSYLDKVILGDISLCSWR